jgi:beta-phosphoglucomutase-like phosphatase (HAD superfamily)
VIATLLDFDGVLVDSEPVHLAAFNDVLSPLGIVIDEREYAARYLSLDDAGVFRAAIARHDKTLREEDVRALVAAKSRRFMERFEEAFRVFPGAPELVARRAARGPVAIVSGALEKEIVFALAKMGVKDAVTLIVSAERPVPSKPDPAPFRLAVEELRALGLLGASRRAVAVEDSIGGVTSAKGAGLRCAAVAHTYPAADLARAGADAVVADLFALTDDVLEGVGA